MRKRPAGLSVAAALCLIAAAAEAESGAGSPTQFLLQEQQRAASLHAPVHHTAPVFNRPTQRRATAERRPGPRPAIAAAVPAAPAPIRVSVYGDRFGQALAGGLEDDAGPSVAVTPFTTDDAGLARADFDERLAALRERLKGPRQTAVAVVMLGSNDRQPIMDGATSLDPASARWREIYGSRVDAMAAAFREAHVPLIWVGLPSVHGAEASADFVRLNGIIRDHVERAGATYVDSWEAFSDDAGRYSPVGPDVDGQSVRLRKADGFGFTRAGARKLASFVTGDIKRHRAPDAAPASNAAATADITIERPRDFDQALEIDVNAQIRREAGLAPGTAKVEPTPDQPAAGPVLALTAPPVSADGQLVTVEPGSVQASLVARPPAPASTQAAPKPGRADDFAWPCP